MKTFISMSRNADYLMEMHNENCNTENITCNIEEVRLKGEPKLQYRILL